MGEGAWMLVSFFFLCSLAIPSSGTLVGFSYNARRSSANSSPIETISFLKKNKVSPSQIRAFVSNHSGLNALSYCSAIQSSGSCYNPNTQQNHASYAFNSYYQKNPSPTSCVFKGVATLTTSNPKKHRRADHELKKRVMKLELCLQEARSQTRKLQRMGERRDQALKELKDQLATTKKQGGGNCMDKQNLWESLGFKLVMSMSMLILVVFGKR